MIKKDIAKFLLGAFDIEYYTEIFIDKEHDDKPAFVTKRIGGTGTGQERYLVGINKQMLEDFIKEEDK